MVGIGVGLALGRSARLASSAYALKVRDVHNPVAYWPLWETSGTTAENFQGEALRDGTYDSVTLNDEPFENGADVTPGFDGTSSNVQLGTLSLGTALTPAEMSISMWFKVRRANVWSDGNGHYAMRVSYTLSNSIVMTIQSSTTHFQWIRTAGGVTDTVSVDLGSPTGWRHLGLTVSESGDEMIAYFDGVQADGVQGTLGAWGGTLNQVTAGAFDGTGLEGWNGWLAHVALFNGVKTADEMLDLATV